MKVFHKRLLVLFVIFVEILLLFGLKTWAVNPVEVAKLLAADGTSSQFGFSVSVSVDTIVTGANWDNNSSGSAYIFELIGGVWTQTAKLTASDASSDDEFGISVSISGETVVVGANYNDGALSLSANSISAINLSETTNVGDWMLVD